jgi:hypothetical protein
MGLMQVMPQTYDLLQQRYQLGSDPYEPRSNIMAGAAYIREMYDRYGAPAFLAAYNAGPDRLDAYLTDGTALPDETVNYVAAVAPRLSGSVAMTGPLAAYAGGGVDRDRAYADGGVIGSAVGMDASVRAEEGGPSTRAFAGGGLVMTTMPSGVPPVVSSPPVLMAAQPTAVAAQASYWGIQVGAYADPGKSSTAISVARANAGDLLLAAHPMITPVPAGGVLYRARLIGLSASAASAACERLQSKGVECFTVPPGS